MRKLSLIAAVICLCAVSLYAQSRRRGYNANGGWHQKASAPVPLRRPETRKEKLPKARNGAKHAAPVVAPQKA